MPNLLGPFFFFKLLYLQIMSSIFFGRIFATWGTKKQIGCENPTKDFYFFSPEKWPKFIIPFYHGDAGDTENLREWKNTLSSS
jgi:hypothetical protein